MTVTVMRLGRDDQCDCGTLLPSGSQAGWDRHSRKVICVACLELSDEFGDETTPPPVDIGVPGASLQREYERRLALEVDRPRKGERFGRGRRRRARRVRAMNAFAIGAEGERRVAHHLARSLPPTDYLFNRRYGRRKDSGDIDLIVIVPSGVWIIDAKLYAGRTVRGSRHGLVVAGRLRPRLSASMRRQIDVVQAAVAAGPSPSTPVRAAYCFLDAKLPRRRLIVDGVPVLTLRETTRALQQAGPIGPLQRAALHRELAARFPTA